MNTETIQHSGKIKEIKDNVLLVSIIPQSACSSCSAKGICSEANVEEKIIEIDNFSSNYSIGDSVVVYYAQRLGFRALLLGYVFPFLLMFLVLIFTFWLTQNELISGLLSLIVLIPYYFLLSLKKDLLRKTFAFHIK